ncbi:hypothetical protein AB674_10815 [Flavobacterium sp. ABG]|nr:hypothetical protein AB674_10815 [Flavobacterium sp. ABG]
MDKKNKKNVKKNERERKSECLRDLRTEIKRIICCLFLFESIPEDEIVLEMELVMSCKHI